MKVAILCLFACVAVSQAAFSANLVQQAQPMLARTFFKVRLATSRGETQQMQTTLVAGLQAHVNDLLEQIQNGVELGQQAVADLQQQLHQAQTQLVSLGSVVSSNVVDVVSNLISGVGSIWNNLFGSSNKQLVIPQINFADALQAVQEHLTNLVSQINLPSILQSVLSEYLPADVAAFVSSQLGLGPQNRGIFSDLWNTVSTATSNAWNQITDVAGNILNVATGGFTSVQQLAQDFIAEATSTAQTISAEAAQNFLEAIKPFQNQLGSLYDDVATQVGNIVGNTTGPKVVAP